MGPAMEMLGIMGLVFGADSSLFGDGKAKQGN